MSMTEGVCGCELCMGSEPNPDDPAYAKWDTSSHDEWQAFVAAQSAATKDNMSALESELEAARKHAAEAQAAETKAFADMRAAISAYNACVGKLRDARGRLTKLEGRMTRKLKVVP